MKSNFLPLFVLMLFNSWSGNSLSIDPNQNQNLNEKIKLTDLNEDCLYLTFDKLDLGGLVNAAQIDSKCNNVVTDIFRRKYSDFEIEIEKTEYESFEGPYDIDTRRKCILINDLKLLLNIMKYFANHIRKVTIWNYDSYDFTTGSDWAEANRIVNEYGFEPVTQLKLGFINKELWSLYSKPFKNVEKLGFRIKKDTDGMKLNQLCPKLRELSISLGNEANYDFIDCALPHLQHLDITTCTENVWKYKEQIIGLIQKNPQIRSIDAEFSNPEFNNVISEHLLNLENITLYINEKQKEPLHFENVKHCVLHTWVGFSLGNISFSHLKSLETTYLPEEFNKYTEFFRRHTNLNRIHFTQMLGSTFSLHELTVELPNLKEVVVKFLTPNLDIENVTRFIENHPKLRKFQIPGSKVKEADRQLLRKRFEHDWHIESIIDDQVALLFEKKKDL